MEFLNLTRRPVRLAIAATAGVALLAMFVWPPNLSRGLPGLGRPAQDKGATLWTDTGGPAHAEAPATRFRTGLENLPASLRDTEVPGTLSQDAAGNLIVTHDLRQIFDYFLSIIGDETLASIHARIAAYVGAHLGPKASQQALAILDQYGTYRQALPELAKFYAGERLDQIKARFAALTNLRRESFAPEVVQAFFGDEEAWDRYSIAKREIMENPALTPQQKAAAIADLKQQLPQALQDSAATADLVQTLDQLQQDWKQRGGTPQELRAAREAVVGKDGADRLEALDRANAAWDQRMASYLDQRAQILADPSLADTTRQSQVAALRARLFTGPEAVRAQALETLHDASAAGR